MEIPGEATMIIRYTCKAMGLNCPFMVKGDTMEDVVQKAMEHIQEKHSQDFNSIKTEAQIDQMRKSLARSTWTVGA